MMSIATHEELQRACCDWRGIEEPCKTCGGSGTRAYGSTSTWRGGVGGQAITSGVCDTCWGSGDAYRPWPSRRKMESQAAEISRLTARIAELETALKPFVDEFKACRDSYIRRYPRHPAVGADHFDKMPDDWPMETSDFSMGVFRFARTTLEASEQGGGE